MSSRGERVRRAAVDRLTRTFYRLLRMPEGFAQDPLRLISTRDVEGVLRRPAQLETPRLIQANLALVMYRANERLVTVGVWRGDTFDARTTTLWRDRVVIAIPNLGDVASFWPDGGLIRVRAGELMFQIGCFQVSPTGERAVAPDTREVVEALAARAVRSLPTPRR